VARANNFATFMCRLSRNSGSLNILERKKSIIFSIKNIQFAARWTLLPHPNYVPGKTTVCSNHQNLVLILEHAFIFYLDLFKQEEMPMFYICRGPGSVAGIATRYGLDGPRFESRWGRDFPHLSRPALGPTQPPVQWVPGLFRGQRAAAA